jgi:hypothetical protein
MSEANKQPNECQLQVVYNETFEPEWTDRLRNVYLRLLSAKRRRVKKLRRLVGMDKSPQFSDNCSQQQDFTAAEQTTAVGDLPRRKFKEGQMVRVLTMAELKPVLDHNRQTEGLQFMEGMQRWCGKTLRVRKRVRTIFDERAWRMVKIRNTYILDDAVCDGRGQYDKEGCDRCCFYFWKDLWLEKAE